MMKFFTQKIVLLLFLSASVQLVNAQVKVGENPTSINKGSILELESANKGLLFPRVALTNTTTWSLSTGSTPVAGMVVYNIKTITSGFSGTTAYPAILPDGTGLYYWDFDKSNIRPDAAIELDKVVAVMKENPTIWIVLGSHTDSRGKDQYNQWLSQSRANSAVQYIIDRGIEKSRITAKGYGESRPVNECTNGVKCSEEAHQLNRRTEFTIIKQ